MGKWAVVIALVLIVVAGVVMVVAVNNRKTMVSIGGQVVYARVADTDSERERGLSGTSSLAPNEAMLFIFEVPGRWGMWMKDMHYSLDIVWLDNSKRIVYLAQNISPDTYPTAFLPDTDARYVLELPAGFVAAHRLSTGQTVGFSVR